MAAVLVTGGAGFLGSHLCDLLVERGEFVICLDNVETGSWRNVEHLMESDRFEIVNWDVGQPFHEIPRRGPGLTPRSLSDVEYVFHLASPASPQHYRKSPRRTLNVAIDGTRNALRFAELVRAGVLLASSSEVYGDPQVHPQPETYFGNVDPCGPRGPYGEGKRIAETMLTVYREKLAPSTIARPFNVYGPRMAPDDGRVVPTYVRQALTGAPLTVFGDGSQSRSLCYVRDAVEGLYALWKSGHPGPMNMGNPTEVTMLQLARLVLDVTGSDSPIEHVFPTGPYGEGREAHQRCPDISLAEAELGWWPSTGLHEGIERTVLHAKEEARA